MGNSEFDKEATKRALELYIGKELPIGDSFMLAFARYDLADNPTELNKTTKRFLDNADTQQAMVDVRAALAGLSKDAFASFDEKRKMLWDVAGVCSRQEEEVFQPTATISAISELNRMDGDHAAKKIDVANVGFVQVLGDSVGD